VEQGSLKKYASVSSQRSQLVFDMRSYQREYLLHSTTTPAVLTLLRYDYCTSTSPPPGDLGRELCFTNVHSDVIVNTEFSGSLK
jgi:hypothetical protein